MWVFADVDGAVLGLSPYILQRGVVWRHPDWQAEAARLGLDPEAVALLGVPMASLVATVEAGQVVSVAVVPAPQTPELWLHVALDGGTLSPDGLRYLAHGQELQVAAVLRQTADPESPAVSHLGGQPITYAWAMELADRSGVVRDCPLVQVVEGAASVVYTPPDGYYGYLILDESSFTTIGSYRVRLVDGPIVFKIVRALA